MSEIDLVKTVHAFCIVRGMVSENNLVHWTKPPKSCTKESACRIIQLVKTVHVFCIVCSTAFVVQFSQCVTARWYYPKQ